MISLTLRGRESRSVVVMVPRQGALVDGCRESGNLPRVIQRQEAGGIQSAQGWSWGIGEQERSLIGDATARRCEWLIGDTI